MHCGLHRRVRREDNCRTGQRTVTNWGARLGDAAKQASNVKSPWKAPSKPTAPYLIIFGHAATPLYVGKPSSLPVSLTKDRQTRADSQETPRQVPFFFFTLPVISAEVYELGPSALLLPFSFLEGHVSMRLGLTCAVMSCLQISPRGRPRPAWNAHERGL